MAGKASQKEDDRRNITASVNRKQNFDITSTHRESQRKNFLFSFTVIVFEVCHSLACKDESRMSNCIDCKGKTFHQERSTHDIRGRKG